MLRYRGDQRDLRFGCDEIQESLVEEHHGVAALAERREVLEVRAALHVAGGVVGVADVHRLVAPGGDSLLQGGEIYVEQVLREQVEVFDDTSGEKYLLGVLSERRSHEEYPIPRIKEGEREVPDDLRGPGAHSYVAERESVVAGDVVPHRGAVRVGIMVEPACTGEYLPGQLPGRSAGVEVGAVILHSADLPTLSSVDRWCQSDEFLPRMYLHVNKVGYSASYLYARWTGRPKKSIKVG